MSKATLVFLLLAVVVAVLFTSVVQSREMNEEHKYYPLQPLPAHLKDSMQPIQVAQHNRINQQFYALSEQRAFLKKMAAMEELQSLLKKIRSLRSVVQRELKNVEAEEKMKKRRRRHYRLKKFKKQSAKEKQQEQPAVVEEEKKVVATEEEAKSDMTPIIVAPVQEEAEDEDMMSLSDNNSNDVERTTDAAQSDSELKMSTCDACKVGCKNHKRYAFCLATCAASKSCKYQDNLAFE